MMLWVPYIADLTRLRMQRKGATPLDANLDLRLGFRVLGLGFRV